MWYLPLVTLVSFCYSYIRVPAELSVSTQLLAGQKRIVICLFSVYRHTRFSIFIHMHVRPLVYAVTLGLYSIQVSLLPFHTPGYRLHQPQSLPSYCLIRVWGVHLGLVDTPRCCQPHWSQNPPVCCSPHWSLRTPSRQCHRRHSSRWLPLGRGSPQQLP